MLDHGHGGLIEIKDQVDGRINIHKVVVGEFLSVQLGKNFVQFPVEQCFLVRILAVPHRIMGEEALLEDGNVLPAVIEAEDLGVVVG